ncbi:MAG TPA: potassium channel protein [Dehalococcoidia bacterium]|nr:potassium channel protein [Dehalococcoidia bacterium]
MQIEPNTAPSGGQRALRPRARVIDNALGMPDASGPTPRHLRQAMTARRRLAVAAGLFGAVFCAGIAGYLIIEGWNLLDAVYMTVTTVTTVGFREVRPLSTAGRIFTIVLVLLGVGTAFYLLTAAVALIVEGDLPSVFGYRRMRQKIHALSDHYILCGFGRVGQEIAREFRERGVPFVIVESNEEALSRALAQNYLVVEGDATADEVLIEAGIHRARGLLAASDSDTGNTYITLTAKALNPRVFVVARAGQAASRSRLTRAGADRVISPYTIGGRRMALSALQPMVLDFIDLLAVGRYGEQILAEVQVEHGSTLDGATLARVFEACPSAKVLGLQRPSGQTVVGPGPEEPLAAGDRLIILGNEADLATFSERFRGPAGERATAPHGEAAQAPLT